MSGTIRGNVGDCVRSGLCNPAFNQILTYPSYVTTGGGASYWKEIEAHSSGSHGYVADHMSPTTSSMVRIGTGNYTY